MEYYDGQIITNHTAFANWTNSHGNKFGDRPNGDGTYTVYAVPEPPAPTHDDIKQARAKAYQQEVDPITSHIQRLRDAEQTDEITAEIAELIAERDAKVVEIKERLPYPDEN